MHISEQRIVIFPANRNRFTEPTYVRIGMGVVRESQNLRIGIWIIFVRWELFANYSQISLKKNSLILYIYIYFFFTLIYFSLEKLTGQTNHSGIYAHSLNIFPIKIRYSWILCKIFVNRNIIRQIRTLSKRNNIPEMKMWQIGIGIYLWPKYQWMDSWPINLQTIRELFTNRELFAEHWSTKNYVERGPSVGVPNPNWSCCDWDNTCCAVQSLPSFQFCAPLTATPSLPSNKKSLPAQPLWKKKLNKFKMPCVPTCHKVLELVVGGSVINRAYLSSLLQLTSHIPIVLTRAKSDISWVSMMIGTFSKFQYRLCKPTWLSE